MSATRAAAAGQIVAGIAIVGAAIVLLGWTFDVPDLTTFFMPWTPMVATTAAAVLAVGFAAIVVARQSFGHRTWNVVTGVGAVVALNGLFVQANFASAGLRGVPLLATGPPGRMALPTAIAFAAIGAALVLFARRTVRSERTGELLLATAMLIAAGLLLAFLFGANPRSDLMGRVNMSPLSASGLLLVCSAVLLVVPDGWFVTQLTSPGTGSQITRRLLPLAVVIPVLVGFIRLEGERHNLFELAYGVAVMVLAMLVLIVATILWAGAHANRRDADRRLQAEREQFLMRASGLINASRDMDTTLAGVANLCVPQIADWCSVTLRRGDGALDTVAVVHQDPGKVAWAREYQRRFPPNPDDTTGVAAIMRTGQPEFYPEIPDTLLAATIQDARQLAVIRALGIRSAISVPLKSAGETLGVLSLITSESRRLYRDDDVRIALQLAERCAAAIRNAQLFGELQRELQRRQQAEEQQRRAYDRYRELFESSPLPKWMFDTDTLSFLAVNQAAIEHYGYTAEEFLSMTLLDIRPAEDVDRLLEHVSPVHGRRTHQARHRKKDGTLIDVEVTATEVAIEGRHARLAVVNDVTARNKAEAQLRQLAAELEGRVARRTAELEVANRELEAFAYSVSHDLRTPLRAMDGFSQAMLEDYGDRLDAAGRDYLLRIRRGSQRMGDLIDALLDLSRVSRGQMNRQTVDLSAIARNVIGSLRERAPDRAVDVHIEDGLTATGDPRLLRALLENLLANAWKFTARRERACVEFRADASNGALRYMVRDNGAGFDPAHAGKLFGAFQRLHDAKDFDGTGVGLATAQRIVHRHGGQISAQAAPDRGATFYFTLT